MSGASLFVAGSKPIAASLIEAGAEVHDAVTKRVEGRRVIIAPSAAKGSTRVAGEREAQRALRMGAELAGYIEKPPIGADVRDYFIEANGAASLEKLLACVQWIGGPPAESTAPRLPVGETAFALVERDMPEPEKLCNPWAVEGLNLLASRPKLGKTTLVRQKACAIAVGEAFLDAPCISTPCAILSLEEGPRVMREKFKRAAFPDAALAGLTLFYEWPRGAEGVALLARWLHANPSVKYIAIDSLSRFRDVPDARTPAFVADYEAMNRLHDLTNTRPGLVLDVIHHTRKAKGDDPIDDISGTYGLTAACDSYMVLRRSNDGATMHVGGRLWDREESDYELARKDQRWHLVGAADGLTDGERFTLDMLRKAGGMTATELGKALNCSRQNAYKRLDALFLKGKVRKEGSIFAVCI